MNLQIGFRTPSAADQLRYKGLAPEFVAQLERDKTALERLMKRGLVTYSEAMKIKARFDKRIERAILDTLPF